MTAPQSVGAQARSSERLVATGPLAVLVREQRHPVAPHVAAELARLVTADPDCLLQTAAALTPEQLAGTAMLPDPLPAVAAVREAVGPLDLDDVGRRILLVASVAVVDRTDVVLAAAGADLGALLSGPAARHLELAAGRFRFVDPRVRSVLHDAADLAARTAAHQGLARAHRASGEHAIALWHIALSTIAGDPLLADGLVELALQHLQRGDTRRAHEVAREAASHGTGTVRARAFHVAGRAALWGGHVHDALVALRRAADRTSRIARAGGGSGPAVAAGHDARPLAAALALLDGRGPEVLAAAELAADRYALVAAGRALSLAHDAPADARGVLARAVADLTPARGPGCWFDGPDVALTPLAEAHLRVAQVLLAVRKGDMGGAQAVLEAAAARLPVGLVLGGLGVALARRVDLVRDGDVGTVATALEAAAPTRLVRPVRAAILGDRALTAAYEGRFAQAATLLGLAAERGGEHLRRLWLPTPDPVELYVLARQPEAAWLTLARLRRTLGDLLAGTPPDDGAHLLQPARTRQGALRRTLDVARAELALADAAGVADACERAVRVSIDVGSTFERGLTELVAGRTYARLGAGEVAAAHLLAAQELLDESGARVWVATAGRALAQAHNPAGARPADAARPGDPAGVGLGPCASWAPLLTERELDVARLVVDGRSNREVAEKLYVSVRTVEVHLGRVFRKLGVRSRTELVVLALRAA
ncbi:LuxR C-terminal-related transcriptional regulator [Antribacter sp. KLBMP9083]|uniref:LuxR C-terminal-related transcriptional regulator n=1 Tax=Antribacter soli TaxID=2910976 RepID=A0AA41U7Y7_9MICO|nr:helix-turn-helix transcriptional regulator [Antribacter soli]MCF4122101.1 LuxR C-terminal-related transcriptional regulator [Antribacter soli]